MIYFDHNASTPLHPEVLAEMMPYLQGGYANPSSVHSLGRAARQAIDKAREQVADLVNAHPSQVIFTSGGSEANNFAIKGCVQGMGLSKLVVSSIEHPSVKDVADYFSDSMFVELLEVDSDGVIGLQNKQLQTQNTDQALLSIMMANNETGVVQDIAKLAKQFQQKGCFVHTDAVQAAGKMKVDFQQLNVNLLTLSAHKLYGPKGVGALIFDKRIDLETMVHGGGQERNQRSGTENVAAIVGFGKAAELAKQDLIENVQKLKNLQQYFERQLHQLPNVTIFAENAERLPNTTFFGIKGMDGETLLMQLDAQGIAVTSGSACASTSLKPSHVLVSMGVDDETARSAVRVSFGLQNTEAEIDQLIYVLRMQIDMLSSLAILEY